MGLSIFSFDLSAWINSLSTPIAPAPPIVPITNSDQILSKTLGGTTAQNLTFADTIIKDVLVTNVVQNALASLTAPKDVIKKETVKDEKNDSEVLAPEPIAAETVDVPFEDDKKAILQLIRSLQTSITYVYQSTDIANEHISRSSLINFFKASKMEEPDQQSQILREEKRKAENLCEELKKSILKNNGKV